MLQNVTFCYVFAVFSVDWLNRDPVAELGGWLHRGRISPVAAGFVCRAGIGGMGDSYPDLVDADWAIPC
jgi:hypothetical protein